MQCVSVRKKGSLDQCSASAIRGLNVCGRHARTKPENLVLWSTANKSKSQLVVKLQALVRGWLLRRRLKLGGPGVLSRKNLANGEDLETFDSADKVDPFDYFAFEENGKIWWFRFPTIWKWYACTIKPTNPYTKVPLSSDTGKRLRSFWSYVIRRTDVEPPAERRVLVERIQDRWNILCHMFEENGFGDFNPGMFYRMSPRDYVTFFRLVRDDLPIVFPEKSKTRRICHHCCSRLIRQGERSYGLVATYTLQATYGLLRMSMEPKDPYVLCFTFLSALYRL